MISFSPAAGRGLRASLRPSSFPFRLGVALLAAVVAAAALVYCGGPQGSDGPPDSSAGTAATLGEIGGSVVGVDPSASASAGAVDVPELTEIGGQRLEVVSYPVADALDAEGGAPVRAMLEQLGVAPSDVELLLAVASSGDPAVSRWHLPGADAASILSAWEAAADGAWTEDELDGIPALVGEGPDAGRAWVVARDGCFVYIRTDDRDLAQEIAAAIPSCG